MIVVSDTSPLSYLRQIGRLSVLAQLFNEVLIPPTVLAEWRCDSPAERELLEEFPWVRVVAPQNKAAVADLERVLDRGESEAIVLAEEQHAELLLIDERDGRAIAEQRGLTITGVLGILLRSKQSNLLPAVRPEIQRLLAETNFRADSALIEQVLALAGEISHSP